VAIIAVVAAAVVLTDKPSLVHRCGVVLPMLLSAFTYGRTTGRLQHGRPHPEIRHAIAVAFAFLSSRFYDPGPPLFPWRLVLASASPRRRHLLHGLDLPVEITEVTG
jgi:hypothetical protein